MTTIHTAYGIVIGDPDIIEHYSRNYQPKYAATEWMAQQVDNLHNSHHSYRTLALRINVAGHLIAVDNRTENSGEDYEVIQAIHVNPAVLAQASEKLRELIETADLETMVDDTARWVTWAQND